MFSIAFFDVMSQDVEVKSLSFNKRGSDELAPFFHDSVLYFCSNRKSSVIKSVFDQNGQYLFKLYQSKLKYNGTWTAPEIAYPQLQSEVNNGAFFISESNDVIYITKSQSFNIKSAKRTGKGDKFGVFEVKKENDNWQSEVKSLPFNSQNDYSTGHASLSNDGKYLFFSSDMNRGYGAADIYCCEKIDGVWGEPVNVGNRINTPRNELFPFVDSSGKLFFASDGLGGKGGLDIYYSVKEAGAWSEPVALEEPVNTEFDDYALMVLSNDEIGFFTSNRNNSEDIYMFKQMFPKFETVKPQKADKFCFTFFENGPYQSDTLPFIYRWTFGDGVKAKGLKVRHCFPGPGKYKIKLNVVDTLQNIDLMTVAEHDVELKRKEQVFISSADTVKINEPVSFNAHQSYFENLTPKDYYWTFEDGKKEKGVTIVHIFRKTGKQNVLCGTVDKNDSNKKFCSLKEIVVIE